PALYRVPRSLDAFRTQIVYTFDQVGATGVNVSSASCVRLIAEQAAGCLHGNLLPTPIDSRARIILLDLFGEFLHLCRDSSLDCKPDQSPDARAFRFTICRQRRERTPQLFDVCCSEKVAIFAENIYRLALGLLS